MNTWQLAAVFSLPTKQPETKTALKPLTILPAQYLTLIIFNLKLQICAIYS